jgi:hypothetical protein
MNNKKYAKTVFDHWMKMANKLLAPDSKFANLINISTSSGTLKHVIIEQREVTPVDRIAIVSPMKSNGRISDEKFIK